MHMGISIGVGRATGSVVARAPKWLVGGVAAGVLVLACASAAVASTYERRPVLFVHGVESAGSNFASQEMRFESNGYPHGWVEALDYNSLGAAAENYNGEVEEQIEKAIEGLKQRSGKSQVVVVGHSEGTKVMYHYLAESPKAAEHRESVAAYVNLDGQQENPKVRTLAVWAERSGPTGPEGRHMEGAENVTMPDMTHVQSATSSQTFIQIFKFFRHRLPIHDIIAKKSVQLAGKALEFPQNTGLAGDTVEVWPVNFNGERTTKAPIASFPITDGSEAGGAWGPVSAKSGQRYEFALVKPSAKTLHVYMEPFVRSDYDIRLLGSVPIEQVASCTAAPASRRALCTATGSAVACCSASPVKSHRDGSANLAVALRRNSVVSTNTADRPPKRSRTAVTSAIRDEPVSRNPLTSTRSRAPAADRR